MAEPATKANSSRSPVESVPPPCRIANATTKAAPSTDAIQNSGFGRSWVMTTATNAVAIGRIPSTTPPCEASTVCTASAISSGNRMVTQSIATVNCGHSRRGGNGRGRISSSTSAQRPAIAVRSAVNASGSNPETAMRVAGSVPPKTATPMNPSNRPRRSRDNKAEGMAREVASLAAGVQPSPTPHGGHAPGIRSVNTAPHQTDPGQKQQPKHDVAEILVAQRMIGARTQPCTDHGAGKSQQREPDHLHVDESGDRLQDKSRGQYRPVEGLENGAALFLVPAAHTGPQNGKRTGQAGEAAQNAAGESH